MIKIFLVEDDTFLSKMYVDKLSREEGYSIEAAELGEDAFARMKKNKPSLVLLDIILPDINGVQVLKRMKEDSDLADVPVIILTNLNEKDYINEALALGANDYLIKAHFTPNEVIDKIKQILHLKNETA